MNTPVTIGNINERGYLNGMRRRGYTPQKCILELWANSIDSFLKQAARNLAKKIIAKISHDLIKLIDNAAGMNQDSTKGMFSMHNENHSGDFSMGVSGIGAKPSTLILSEETTVKIFTHTAGGEYLVVTVPWDTIMRDGIYTGRVIVSQMTPLERTQFTADRREHGMLADGEAIGTTIQFQHTDGLQDILHQNFIPISESSITNPLDRISCVFGKMDDIEFEYHCQGSTPITMQRYNYFQGHAPDYYGGIRTDTIQHWHSTAGERSDRYILVKPNGLKYEINKSGRGYDKEPKKLMSNTLSYQHIGDYTVKTGCKTHQSIFDYDAPAAFSSNGFNHPYDKQFLGENPNDEFLGSTRLVRNRQLIGVIPPADFRISSARGNADTWLEFMLTHQELQYNPVSQQDNRQDVAMGIQENKNQFNGGAIPLNLTRLLRTIRKEKVVEMRTSFEARIQEMRPAVIEPVVEPIVEPVVEPIIEPIVQPVVEPVVELPIIVPEPLVPLPLVTAEDDIETSENDAFSPPAGIKGQEIINLLAEVADQIQPGRMYTGQWDSFVELARKFI